MLFRSPDGDDDWPTTTTLRTVALATLRQSLLFPLRDDPTPWQEPAQGRQALADLLQPGTWMAAPYHHWEELRSPVALARFAFAGLGGHRTAAVEGLPEVPEARWRHDTTELLRHEVREGHERYGTVACFDAARRPVAIWWGHAGQWVRPGDSAWDHAAWAWRSSTLVAGTLVDHLARLHWLLANHVVSAARVTLSPEHWLARWLAPFTFRTATINVAAVESLLPEYGLAHRGTAFTYPGLVGLLREAVDTARWESIPNWLDRKGPCGPGDFPWAHDARALWSVVTAFVEDYLGRVTSPAALAADPEVAAFHAALAGSPGMAGLPPVERLGEILERRPRRRPRAPLALPHLRPPQPRDRGQHLRGRAAPTLA